MTGLHMAPMAMHICPEGQGRLVAVPLNGQGTASGFSLQFFTAVFHSLLGDWEEEGRLQLSYASS